MTREMLDYLAVALDYCPRCSDTVDRSANTCPDHDDSDGLCAVCGNRKAVLLHTSCRNCIYRSQIDFVYTFFASTEFLAFLTDHGVLPFSIHHGVDPFRAIAPYEVEVLSIDPFRARFAFTVDDETLSLTVDDGLEVVQATRS